MKEIDALQQALATEHAVIYSYSAAGARLAERQRKIALDVYDEHRAARDRLTALIQSRGGDPVAAAPAYDVRGQTTDPAAALNLLVSLEESSAAAYATLLGSTDSSDLRRIAVGALSDAAVHAAGWRQLARPHAPATVAFPGLAVGALGA